MAHCPVCGKLTVARPGPRTLAGAPRVRLGEHDDPVLLRASDSASKTIHHSWCSGSGMLV